MKTVILCGGKGERLKDYNSQIPKPMWEIKGRPLIWHVMSHYSNHGFNDFILCTGHQHEVIEAYLTAERKPEWNILFDNAGENAGTAQRVSSAFKHIDSGNFFCTYADGLSNIHLQDLYNQHLAEGKLATITAVKTKLPFGVFKLKENNQVESFVEKPVGENWLNGGFFVLSKNIQPFLESTVSLEESLFNQLILRNQLNLYFHNGYWKCMDTYKDYIEITSDFETYFR